MPDQPVRSAAAAVQARTGDDRTTLGGPPVDVCADIVLEGDRAVVAHPALRSLPSADAFDLDGDGREEVLAATGTDSPTILRLRASATRVAVPEVLPAGWGACPEWQTGGAEH